MALALYRLGAAGREALGEFRTNADGRVEGGLLRQADTPLGAYEIEFNAGDYLKANGGTDAYLTRITIRFSIYDQTHYHVPLLLSSFGYSTYRGS